MSEYQKKICEVLESMVWVHDKNNDYENTKTYYKENNIGVDVSEKEVTFISDVGDFYDFCIDHSAVYTMLGFMFVHRYINLGEIEKASCILSLKKFYNHIAKEEMGTLEYMRQKRETSKTKEK